MHKVMIQKLLIKLFQKKNNYPMQGSQLLNAKQFQRNSNSSHSSLHKKAADKHGIYLRPIV